jgi:MFS family permease
VGLVITVGSLVLSSYAKEVWQLIASQGVLCAIGSGLLFSPTTLYLDEWFIARKGMAYGTIWAGKSAAGVGFPFLMSSLLDKYGTRTTLQVWAVTLVIITSPLLFFLKPRIPLSNSVRQRPLSWTFLKQSTFWMLQFGNVVQSFGYILPNAYLASYTHTMGLPAITGAALLAVFALASVPGGIVLGLLGDRFKDTTEVLISSLGSTVAVFALWGLAKNFPVLVLFAIMYGFFAGGFSSTYPGMLHELKKRDANLDTGLVMGLLLGGRGVGFVAGGPASGALLKSAWSTLEGMGVFGYKTEYGPIIVCTGATALLGGWGWMWKVLRQW